MTKDYAERFPTKTALEVYTPDNPPPYPSESDPLSLHLSAEENQTILQQPIFDAGLISNGDITIKAGKKIYLDG